MISRRHATRPLTLLLIGALLTLQAGCAAGRRQPLLPSEARASLGTVGVVAPPATPEVEARTAHSAGRSAASAAEGGLKIGMPFMAMGRAGGPATVIGVAGIGLSLAGALVAAPIGAIVGAVKAPPRKAVKAAEADLAREVEAFDVGGCLEAQTLHGFRERRREWTVLARPVARDRGGAPAGYRGQAGEALDAVLVFGTPHLEVSGPLGVHPDGALVLTVPVDLVRLADQAMLVHHTFREGTSGAPFESWPADAPRFHEALAEACAGVARDLASLVEDAFWTGHPDWLASGSPE